jgi:leucyl aminopeptidase
MASVRAQLKCEVLWQTRATIANPQYMEDRVREIVEGCPQVKEMRVIRGKQLVEQGMNLFYNVGMGANCEPRNVLVHYVGDDSRPDEVDLAIVGKGITFDSGGLNIKMHFMEQMHGDKGGSCAVAGAL